MSVRPYRSSGAEDAASDAAEFMAEREEERRKARSQWRTFVHFSIGVVGGSVILMSFGGVMHRCDRARCGDFYQLIPSDVEAHSCGEFRRLDVERTVSDAGVLLVCRCPQGAEGGSR